MEVHQELNPLLWENEQLKPEVSAKLTEIANEFIKYIEIPLNIVDIEIVGSNASYNYNENSDIDLHIIVNSEVNYVEPEILRQLYNAKKGSFNDNYDLSIEGIPVELYIEDVKDGNATNGRYSLSSGSWVMFPEPIEYDIPDITQDLNGMLKQCEYVMQSEDEQDILDLVNQIYMLRKLGLATDGEASVGNLIFKELRNMDMLSQLKDRYYEIRSNKLSEEKEIIEEVKMENKEKVTSRVDEASLSRLQQHIKGKNTFAVIGSQDKDTKKSRFAELKSMVSKLRDKINNLGFNYLEGTYTYEDGEQGIEDSLIVYNIPKVDALSIAQKLNQESIIWKDDKFFGFLDANGSELDTFNRGSMTFDNQITNMFGSRLRSGNGYKPAFAFECKLIETDNKGSTFSMQHNSAIKKYPVCSIKLEDKTEENGTHIFWQLVDKLQNIGGIEAIDSVDITNFIVENDLLTFTDTKPDKSNAKIYDVWHEGDLVGQLKYDDNWSGKYMNK